MPIRFSLEWGPQKLTYPQIIFSPRISTTLFSKVTKKINLLKIKNNKKTLLGGKGRGRPQLDCALANVNQ